MRAVGDRVGGRALTGVLRQRDRTERRALGQLHADPPGNYLGWADHEGRVAVHTEARGRRR